MECAWCSKCHKLVSLAHAVLELPCPGCGAVRYLKVLESPDRDALLAECERMMRVGNWKTAQSALESCHDNSLISDADFNLSSVSLEWRMQCSLSASEVLKDAGGRIPVEELRSALLREYDEHTVLWLLREYMGLRLLKSGKTYMVEDAYGDEET